MRDFIAGLDAKSGKVMWKKYVIPAPGEPGSETWKDKNNAWQTGGGAMWVTGTYDVATNQVIWGTGNPVPMFDPSYRPGDNLYTNSVISWDPDSGKMNWFFQYTPGDIWDYDEEGTHILIDGQVNGEPRKLITHSARNGFLYTFERSNGQTVLAKPYLENINWTKGIDQKTGKPVDYDPNSDIQVYSGKLNQRWRTRPRSCARRCRVATILAVGLQPEDQAVVHSGAHVLRGGHAGSALSKPAIGRAAALQISSATRPISSPPIRSPATLRSAPCPTPISAARWSPAAALSSPATTTAPSPPTMTPPCSSSGRSMSARASTRRR